MPDAAPMNLVICTHGPPAMLPRTLDSLAAAARPASFEKIWVVENGSDAGARQVCEQFADRLPLQYEHHPTPGKNKALKQTIEKIGAGLVLFTDDDVRVNQEIFTHYAEAAHSDSGVYGGPLLIDYEKPPLEWLKPYLPASVVGWSHAPADQPVTEPCFLGANWGAFAERIIAVGNFNPELGPGSTGNGLKDEMDMQQRLFDGGCRGVYVPGAQVWHYVPPQHCSPAWMLHRAYRVWLSNGLLDENDYAGPRLRGVPRWMWRRAIGKAIKAFVANFVPDVRTRFEMKMAYHQWRGFMKGVELRLADKA